MRPSNLVYGLEDRPPLIIAFFLGLQHVSIISIAFVFPVMVVRIAGGSAEQAAFMVSMSMLAGAVGVAVQAWPRLGSGYLCPQLCGPSYLAATLLAVLAFCPSSASCWPTSPSLRRAPPSCSPSAS